MECMPVQNGASGSVVARQQHILLQLAVKQTKNLHLVKLSMDARPRNWQFSQFKSNRSAAVAIDNAIGSAR